MKVLNVEIRRWFDKHNGNSYFAARATLMEADKEDITVILPFQYGYGSHPEFEVAAELKKQNLLPIGDSKVLSLLCSDNNTRLIINDHTCLKRECKFSND